LACCQWYNNLKAEYILEEPNDKVVADGDNGEIGCGLFTERSDEEDSGMSLFDDQALALDIYELYEE
jgi:hypothetical protein